MTQPLRRSPTHLNLSYGQGETSDGLMGRRFMLETEGSELTVSIDLTINFQTRNKLAPGYVDAMALVRNYQRLRNVQCADNLVRTRLVRTWEEMKEPRLRMELDLGSRGRYLYSVRPHLLFMGGVQLDVQEVLGVLEPAHSAEESA